MKNSSSKIIKIRFTIFTRISSNSTLLTSIYNIIRFTLRTIYTINPPKASKKSHSYLIIRCFNFSILRIIHNNKYIINKI